MVIDVAVGSGTGESGERGVRFRRVDFRVVALFLVAVVVFVAAWGAFWSATDNEFIWDDPIIFSRQLPYFDSFSNVFFPPKRIPQFGTHYYRPLIVVSYQIDEWISGKFWSREERQKARQFVYHSSVVLYHSLASLLVFLLGLRLSRLNRLDWPLGAAAAGGAALVFAVHPIHVESVAWMAGRSDVICAIFVIASLITYLRYKEAPRLMDLICALGFAFCAMLSKETGVCLLMAIPLVDLLIRGSKTKAAPAGSGSRRRTRRERRKEEVAGKRPASGAPLWLRWAALALVWLVYSLLRSEALGSGSLRSSGHDLASFFGAIGWYLRKIVWPGEQSAFVSDLPGVAYVVGGVLVSLAAAYALYRFVRLKTYGGEAISMSLIFVSLAPSLAIVMFRISETPLAERYTYLPSVALCLLAGLLLARVAARIPKTLPAALAPAGIALVSILIAIPASYATLERGAVWQNDLAFWTDTVRKAPDQGLPHLHLGLTYNKLKREAEALSEYKQALAKYDDTEGRSKAYNNMGTLYLSQGKIPQAVEALRGALKERPRYPTANYNLALCEERLGHTGRAEALLRTAIKLNPRYTKAHLQLGRLLLRRGHEKEGAKHLKNVLQMAPASREAETARRLMSNSK